MARQIIKEQEMSKTHDLTTNDDETKGSENGAKKGNLHGIDSKEPNLPENVTEAPRSDEEMHLKHIRKWPNAVQAYLKVSDDQGRGPW